MEEKQPVVLAFGPDTAYYTIRPTDEQYQPVRRELDEDLQDELETLKKQAQEQDEMVPTRWAFHGQTLFMRDKGGSQFKWILENDFIILSIGRGKKTGVVGQVRLGSEYLWTCCGADLARGLVEVHVFLALIYGKYITLDMSALDLAADVLHLDMSALDIKECFISRAVKDGEDAGRAEECLIDGPDRIDRRWKKLSGLTFGRHTSAVSAVIYNKTNEIRYESPEKKWEHDLWRRNAGELGVEYSEFSQEMTVWRVEIRFKRLAFRQFPDVSGAYDVLGHLRDLWTYAVGHPGGGDDGLPDGWLRYVVPSEDSNRARWPVHPAWEVVQHAFEDQPLPESEMEREEQEREALLQELDEYLEAHPVEEEKTLFKRQGKRVKGDLPEPALDPKVLTQFVRTRKREVNLGRGIAQMAGWLSTIEAWRGGYEVDKNGEPIERDFLDTLSFLAKNIDAFFVERGLDFEKLVQKKRVAYRLQEFSALQDAA
jgi:hypothetical protein